MSDQSQGPGWWQASDGKWYPPAQQPAAPAQPAPGWQAAPTAATEHPQGTTVLILGILSLVVCGLVGPVAWSMGNKALAEIDRNPAAYTNRGNVVAGRICGIIASILLAVGLVVVILILALAAGSSTT